MGTDIEANLELDCVGQFCPIPISLTKESIEKIEVGEILKVEADDPAAEEDISRWVKRTGHQLISMEKSGGIVTFFIKKSK